MWTMLVPQHPAHPAQQASILRMQLLRATPAPPAGIPYYLSEDRAAARA